MTISCERCRKRKKKCDGNKPTCGWCIANSQPCHYGQATKRGPSKGYISHLEMKCAYAEQSLKILLCFLDGIPKDQWPELKDDDDIFEKLKGHYILGDAGEIVDRYMSEVGQKSISNENMNGIASYASSRGKGLEENVNKSNNVQKTCADMYSNDLTEPSGSVADAVSKKRQYVISDQAVLITRTGQFGVPENKTESATRHAPSIASPAYDKYFY